MAVVCKLAKKLTACLGPIPALSHAGTCMGNKEVKKFMIWNLKALNELK